MGRSLHERAPSFRAAFDACDRLIERRSGLSPASILYGGHEGADELLVQDTHAAQLALFALEYALASLWREAGITPSFAIGHSVGELVAHAASGALSLPDAVALVHDRARLMQAATHDGAMLSAPLDADAARALIAELGLPLHVAAVNGRRRVAVSGEREVVQRFARHLEERRISCRSLRTRHAFHSPFFAEPAAELARLSRAIPAGRGSFPVAGNLDGELVPAGALDGSYWARHIVMPVEFARGVDTLVSRGVDLFLEVGPDRVLSRVIAADHGPAVRTVSSLERGRDAEEALLRAAGALFELGVEVDVSAVSGPRRGARVSLPARRLTRKRYWTAAGAEPPEARSGAAAPSGAAPARPAFQPPAAAPAAAPDPDSSVRVVIDRQLRLMKAQLALLGDG
jgi:acyl transferase domain-containing protein